MENPLQKNNDSKCINCRRSISSVINQSNPILISTEQDYQNRIASGVGMYCPNCDHIVCLACLPIVKEKGKTNLLTRLSDQSPTVEMNVEDIPADSATRKRIEEMQLKGMKISVLKCTTCEAYFGELRRDKSKRWEDLTKKITDNYDNITYEETSNLISDLHVFISRLEKHNLIRERIDNLKNIMEETLDKVALPKLKQVIMVCIDKRQFDEAKKLCSQAKLWTGLMKNKGNWEQNIEEIECLIDMTKLASGQKATIEARPSYIYVKAREEQIQKEVNMTKQERAKVYYDFVEKQGYRPEIDSDGDIMFKREGKSYYIVLDDQDSEYFRLAFPNFYKIKDEAERVKIEKAALSATAGIKIAKVYPVKDQVWAWIEALVSEPHPSEANFERFVVFLGAAVNKFLEELQR